ncbi:hypothetical protein GGQ73_000637 [Rhizobium skierniewicense]|uniref:Glycine-rich domain-containing protein n=1 Tax=Rhizobium skierniewicense TaxID=984260 RepID=A0A7W6C2S6_9HYPH|nr:hypothetical protein [Rhizobium skierniewicense]MBB3944712.1 hypothetical protein [Rhizobium skierniewicense]
MTTPYTTGTVSVTAGSTTVTGNGTGWLTGGIVPYILGVDGLSAPVATVVSDTELTLAVGWPGPSASGKSYWLTYDTSIGQQSIENTVTLAEYLARLDKPTLAALAALTPAANKLPYFGTNAVGALADFPASARSLLGLTGAANKLPYMNGANGYSLVDFPALARSLLALGGAANKLPYQDAANTYATTDLTARARELLASADTSTMKGVLGLSGAIQVVKFRLITASGTYVPDANLVYAVIEAVGGGGGGGAGVSNSSDLTIGAGGGASEYSIAVKSKADLSPSQPVTIGAGGLAGANGGNTSLGSLVVAIGGNGGGAATGAGSTGPGAFGGTGGVGDLRVPGQSGTGGNTVVGSGGAVTRVNSGSGGSGRFGSGGRHNVGSVGQAGQGYGSGGGPGGVFQSTATVNGGPGAPGLVFITEYCTA